MNSVKLRSKSTLIALASLCLVGGLVVAPLESPKGFTVQAKDRKKDKKKKKEEQVHHLYELKAQDPISLEGRAELSNDNIYKKEKERGKIQHLHVKDGQKVKKGDLLFEYEEEEKWHDHEDAVRAKSRLLEERREQVEALAILTGGEYNEFGDRLDYYWHENGYWASYVSEPIGKGGVTKGKNRDASRITRQDALEKQQLPEDQMGDPANEMKNQIRELNHQIEDLDVKMNRIETGESHKVRAMYSGEVSVDEDGLLDESVPLVRIHSDQVTVVGTVDQYDYYLLHEDMEVDLFIDAEKRTIKGQLVNYDKYPQKEESTTAGLGLATGGNDKDAAFGFEILPEEFIQPGFDVSVQTKLSGLVVPEGAVLGEGDKAKVFLYQDGKAVEKSVKLERQGTSYVVKKGLEAGQKLLLNPEGLSNGEEVSVQETTEE